MCLYNTYVFSGVHSFTLKSQGASTIVRKHDQIINKAPPIKRLEKTRSAFLKSCQ